jgi:hypothetical protein
MSSLKQSKNSSSLMYTFYDPQSITKSKEKLYKA